jgi:Na+/proline symporter
MVAETISLGILGLAATLQTLGLIPGLVILLVVGFMATYAGYVIGQFKLAYPHVHSMGDAGEILFGFWGREISGIGAVAFIIFIMGAHLVAGGHTLNVLTDHGSCTVIFVVVIGVISFVGTLPRTLKQTTFLSLISFISVIAAIIIVMADLGIRRPGFEVVDGVMPNKYTLWGDTTAGFTKKLEAVTKIMFAFAGHVAFFSFISELKDPKDFPKALAFLQTCDITMYATSAVVMYNFGGQHIKSPALDSASPLIRKVAWGVAFGTVIIAGVINGHIAVKYLYVRLLRNSKEDVMHQNSWKARGYWAAICALFWFIAFVLAEVIPIFDDIVSITGALFASWFTFGLPGVFWCYLNLSLVKTGRYTFRLVWKKQRNWKKIVLLAINTLLIMLGAFTVSVLGC